MLALISKFRTVFAARIGRCATCMRQSLMAAVAAWAVFIIAWLIGPNGLAQELIGLSALALTGLWLLHVATYAARAMTEARRGDASLPAASTGTEASGAQIGRRRAIGTLLRTAGAGALASVPLALWPTESFAFCGQCTKNADCGVGYVCRNTAPVNSGKVCNECVKG
jgi:hypothetical protein